jgi:transcription elongation factor Elf1
MKIIENWQNKKMKCFFCGETRSVKYEVITLVKNKELKPVCACNKCVLKYRRKIS